MIDARSKRPTLTPDGFEQLPWAVRRILFVMRLYRKESYAPKTQMDQDACAELKALGLATNYTGRTYWLDFDVAALADKWLRAKYVADPEHSGDDMPADDPDDIPPVGEGEGI